MYTAPWNPDKPAGSRQQCRRGHVAALLAMAGPHAVAMLVVSAQCRTGSHLAAAIVRDAAKQVAEEGQDQGR